MENNIQFCLNKGQIAQTMFVKGKFFYEGSKKFYLKGVTYGTFKPDESNNQFPEQSVVEKDFSLISQQGLNSVRTYTVPPKYLLDAAQKYKLKVMVGLPWEQHITFLDTADRKKDIIQRVKEGVLSCQNHPAILCYTIGNEIPAPIVRWYGKNKIEGFLKLLYKAVKQADPQGLVTYVNYPTTEYLDLSFLDFDCFNVYLETPEKLSKYISRLHNLSGDRPLVLAEIGLDSLRNGYEKQAEVLKWQIETVFGKGCAGMFVFAWTDEWWRGVLKMGGPNIIPDEDGPIATCVANAPGGPVHVLSTDEIAEHVPGCNLSVRKSVLMKIGGFDPIYRAAGDDVDVCWQIQEAGYTIGFHPSALVWHHRRNSLKAYWKQQQGYGKAEALLEHKWPEKYNGFGHLTWAGRIYGNGFTLPINVKKGKVFHGTWGSALFQSVYQQAEGFLNCIPLMPEWYLLSALFGILAGVGFLWAPLLALWPVFIASIGVIIIQGVISAVENTSLTKEQERNWKYMSLIVLLHIVQPLARLRGRIKYGLTPWRIRGAKASLKNLTFFKPKTLTYWNETSWKANETWLKEIEQNIIGLRARVKRGGDFDKWDIKTRNGLFSTAKGVLTVEEHGANKQYVKFRYWANYSLGGLLLIGVLVTITTFALLDHRLIAATILYFLTAAIFVKYVLDSASVVNCIVSGFAGLAKVNERESNLNIVHGEKVNEEKEQYDESFNEHEGIRAGLDIIRHRHI